MISIADNTRDEGNIYICLYPYVQRRADSTSSSAQRPPISMIQRKRTQKGFQVHADYSVCHQCFLSRCVREKYPSRRRLPFTSYGRSTHVYISGVDYCVYRKSVRKVLQSWRAIDRHQHTTCNALLLLHRNIVILTNGALRSCTTQGRA